MKRTWFVSRSTSASCCMERVRCFSPMNRKKRSRKLWLPRRSPAEMIYARAAAARSTRSATAWSTKRYPQRPCYFRPMNPYASHMGDKTPLDVISDTPRRLAQLVDTIGPERLEIPPAPGKWSVRDILSHLADGEIAFGFRLRQTLAEDHHLIQPFDQDLWAKGYSSCDARLA